MIRGKSSLVSVFHEIGHAKNHLTNANTLGSFFQKHTVNPYLYATAAIIAYLGVLVPFKKESSDGKRNKLNKFTNFVKNNVGKLAFIPLIPILIKEACASITGLNDAKKVLTPELYKKSVKMAKFGFASYLINALGISIGAYAACKIKERKENNHKK